MAAGVGPDIICYLLSYRAARDEHYRQYFPAAPCRVPAVNLSIGVLSAPLARLTASQRAAPMARPACFTPQSDYTDGRWVARDRARTPPPYRIKASLWEQLGTSIRGSTPQHYGRCDDAMPSRPLYDWVPQGCSLAPFERERACDLLDGKAVLMVGDSTVFQLFLSFALLLGAKLGKNTKRASTVSEMTASACGDNVRLAFSRSDLLLWTTSNSDFNGIKRCDGFTNLQVFVERAARDADYLVLGVGHHFPGSLEAAESKSRTKREPGAEGQSSRFQKLAMHAFFPNNINHTLASVIKARAAWGHAPPSESITLVGTTTPVAGCSRFSTPISLSQYAIESYDHRRVAMPLGSNPPAPLTLMPLGSNPPAPLTLMPLGSNPPSPSHPHASRLQPLHPLTPSCL